MQRLDQCPGEVPPVGGPMVGGRQQLIPVDLLTQAHLTSMGGGLPGGHPRVAGVEPHDQTIQVAAVTQ